jgi:hypothetical protein
MTNWITLLSILWFKIKHDSHNPKKKVLVTHYFVEIGLLVKQFQTDFSEIIKYITIFPKENHKVV